MNWYPIFLREMLQFKKKLFRLGYIFTSMMVPLLYLLAFGLERSNLRRDLFQLSSSRSGGYEFHE